MPDAANLPASEDAGSGRLSRPHLCVILDTEEEFDWGGPFSRRHASVNAIEHLGRGHALFRRFGLVPAYLVDYPIIDDHRAAGVFGPWLAAGECLVGAQLHPWVTPPFEEVVCPFNSYPCNLDPALEQRKLAVLTQRIMERLGVVPRVYKAGRYGLDIWREAMLADLGYEVDTSVLPYRSFAGLGGGPDFFGYPDRPFWTCPSRRVLYLPVSQGLIGPLRRMGRGGLGQAVFGRFSSRLYIPGMLARFHLLERIMLTPEGVSFEEMRRLVDSQLRDGARVFALSLHSPSFMPGGTPYVRSEDDVAALLARTERFLEHFFGALGGVATTPLALKAMLEGAAEARVLGPGALTGEAAREIRVV
ncbi:polysaccharide deacetylase family protein [Falsiroseomonas sp.]|uniref:polysaccharide deacetylase family protein n=1 Tax=Falsiroseomonas sp. TaxID=2870721 RepID=UPI003565B1DE